MEVEIRSDGMKVSEVIKTAILASDKQHKDVAEQMGWSPQSFANRLKKNTIDADEWVAISQILGYELKMVSKDGTVLSAKKKGYGPRIQQMVDGFAYDTERADPICRTPRIAGSSFELCKDVASGKYYIAVRCDLGESFHGMVIPVTKEEAEVFCEGCGVSLE